ncbi:MAG: 16S rRNA (guanine(527)-N(7))-methyltransferase RsmG [Christensenellaceae bacterium]|nr:16S rRNA (guanine(527)-N(7))-methyltransferase RsmG [Christensenellaceae bacterium]
MGDDETLRRLVISKLSTENLSDAQIQSFVEFFKLIKEKEGKINLTAITNDSEIVEKHFLDSISASRLIKTGGTLLDIGSGGGFPGIPLAIIRTDLNVVLLDSVAKKTDFTNFVICSLSIKNARVITARAEEIAHSELRQTFDYVVARAFAPLCQLVEIAIPFLKKGGKLIAYKGNNVEKEIADASGAIKLLDCEIRSVQHYSLESECQRSLVEIVKVNATDAMYPRRYNKIKKLLL